MELWRILARKLKKGEKFCYMLMSPGACWIPGVPIFTRVILVASLLFNKIFRVLLIFFSSCRLHSAGHLLDACLPNIGLGHLKPGKAYHFPDGYASYCKVFLSMVCFFLLLIVLNYTQNRPPAIHGTLSFLCNVYSHFFVPITLIVVMQEAILHVGKVTWFTLSCP